MTLLPWPSVLVPSSSLWSVNKGASRSGGRTQGGGEQVVVGPPGYVTASLEVPCNTRARILAMEGLLDGLDGRANRILVGPCLADRRPAAPRSFRLASAATMNATSLTIQRVTGGRLEVGMLLGLGTRLHRIVALPTADNGAPGNVTVKVRSWLRQDYPANTAVNFDNPVCEMRLASDDLDGLRLSLARRGTVTLDLVEASPEA